MRAFFFLLFSSFFLTSCAQRLDEVQTRVDDIDDRMRVLESNAGVPVGSDRELGEARRIADVKSQLSALKNEMTLIQGKVEALEFESKSQEDSIQALSLDLGRRLTRLEQKLSQATASSDPAEALYQQALRSHQNGDFDKARTDFESFLKSNPKHPLADNAVYWVGEGYMNEREFRKALVQFQDLVEQYPNSDIKCDAMSRQVEAFRALGMEDEAKAFADVRTEECRKQ